MVTFKKLTDIGQSDTVVAMMNSLYREDPASYKEMDPSKFSNTIEHFISEPSSGSVILFISETKVVGYCLLVPYWSNEYGGNILFIDEIFVIPEYRGQGIATSFFTYLEQEKPFSAVSTALEVTKKNTRARILYSSLGFVPKENEMMLKSYFNVPPRK